MLVFTLGISFLTGLLFGLAPAIQTLKLNLSETLKEGGRSGADGAHRNRTRSLLVVFEGAIAVVLLIGAGLLIRSFIELQQVSPGFDAKNVLTMRVDLSREKYGAPEKAANLFEQIDSRVAGLPGVETVGMVSELPLSGQPNDMPFTVEGRPAVNMVDGFDADFRSVNQHYLGAMRIPLLRGRNFTEQDVRGAARVLIVSELLASQVFPDEDPIGKRLVLMMYKDPFEIIGISGDILHRSLESQPFPAMYLPTYQRGSMNLVIRTQSDPMTLASAVRKEIQSIDPDQPVATVRTMESWLYSAVAAPRYRTVLLGLFAAVALLLAAVGIYGVISYTVAQRTNEIGIRLALGARRSDVLMLIVGRGMTLALTGIGVGLAAAFGLTRLMSNLLFGVSATDLMTFAVCAVLLSGVALVACYVPARRATRVDPMVALRNE